MLQRASAVPRDETEEIYNTIAGLPIGELRKKGRRFLMEGSLERLIRGTQVKPYHVYLFTDMLLYAEVCVVKKKNKLNKYVAHKSLKYCLFIDCADTKAMKYAFEILHTDEKKRYTFVSRSLDQKYAWKRNVEYQANVLAEEIAQMELNASGSGGSAKNSPSFMWLLEEENPSPKATWSPASTSFHRGQSFSSASSSPQSSVDTDTLLNHSPVVAASLMTDSPISDSSISTGADINTSWSASTEEEFEDPDDAAKNDDVADSGESIMCVSEDGTTYVKAASVNTILWLLVYGDYTDTSLLRAFLFSYRNFSTAKDLFQLLTSIYELDGPIPRDLPIRYSKHDTRTRVVYFVKVWVEHFFRDFNNREMYSTLLDFLAHVTLEAEHVDEVNLIKLAILRVNTFRVRRIVGRRTWFSQLELTGGASSPGRNSSRDSPLYLRTEMKFADLNINTLAEQLTLQVHRIFLSIHLGELFQLEWKSIRGKKTAPHILTSIDKCNMVSSWVSTEIVILPNPKLRATAIEKFIQLAVKLQELRNFDSVFAVTAGLNDHAVSRLKKTWPLVSDPLKHAFEELTNLVDNKKNYSNYRDVLKRSSLPTIPYTGMYLRDIVMLEEGNYDKIGDMVNFEKIQLYGHIYKQVQHFQRAKYPFPDDEPIQAYLRKLNVMSEDLLYKQSQSIEPIGG